MQDVSRGLRNEHPNSQSALALLHPKSGALEDVAFLPSPGLRLRSGQLCAALLMEQWYAGPPGEVPSW